jgi:hypothetical protein
MKIQFPRIPKCKEFEGQMTPEQRAFDKLVNKQELTAEENKILLEAITFYETCYNFLKSINLSNITDDEAKQITDYLSKVFNIHFLIQNDISFNYLYRVTIVREEFLDKGKVRDTKYLTHPPLELIQKNGVYNRANSPNTTVFYASFNENVALRETKPPKGSKIIISKWKNRLNRKFVSYPLMNNDTVRNDALEASTKAFQEAKKIMHELMFKINDLLLKFLSSEFVKDTAVISPKKYEYIYSSFFADQVLKGKNPDDPSTETDLIVYPSVAYNHREDNVAVTPRSMKDLQLIKTTEYLVKETQYEKPINIENKEAELELLRTSWWIEYEYIIWDDE